MTDQGPPATQPDERSQLNSFCRSVAEIQWLLVALVLLYLVLTDHPGGRPLSVLAGVGVYFVISLSANYLTLFEIERRLLIAFHTLLMIGFVTWVIYRTDGVDGPLVSLYLLAIITSALTLGRLATLLEVGTVAACYLWLFYYLQGSDAFFGRDFSVAAAHVAMFLLMGYLTTLLADAIYSADKNLERLPRLEGQVSGLKERLKRAAEQSTDGFIEMDSSGRITEWNEGATTILGWGREQALGQRARDLVVPKQYRQKHERELAKFLATGRSEVINRRTEMQALTRDGEILPVEVLIHAVEMPDQYYFDILFNEISARKRQHSQLMHRAYIDSVTGLANRNALEERLEAVLERVDSGNESLLVMIDLDRFKEINDQYGHDTGDRLLAQVGRRIVSTVRDRDLVARLGGDEFAIIMEHVKTTEGQLQVIAEKLVTALADPYRLEDREVTVTASVGLALSEGSMDTLDFLRRADKAMYQAKHAGKNQFCIAPDPGNDRFAAHSTST